MKFNKIHIFLIILIFVMAGYLFYKNFAKSDPVVIDSSATVNQETATQLPSADGSSPDNTGTQTNTVTVNPLEDHPTVTLTQEELTKQIKSKQYLEDTYMALEYSKVNNMELRKTIEAYLDTNSQMKPEDIAKLINLHEKTFLNRYLKVYVDAPDAELNDLNSQMRRLFYQIKSGFDVLHGFGSVPVDVPVDPNQTANAGATTTTTTPAKQSSKKKTPNYNSDLLRTGLQQLVATDELVNKALKDLGTEDIKIERKWIDANLSETDIVNAIDSSNPDVLPNTDTSVDSIAATQN